MTCLACDVGECEVPAYLLTYSTSAEYKARDKVDTVPGYGYGMVWYGMNPVRLGFRGWIGTVLRQCRMCRVSCCKSRGHQWICSELSETRQTDGQRREGSWVR